MSLFMNNRLIVSKQYQSTFGSQNIALYQYFSGFADYSSSMVAGGLPVQS